MNDAEEAAYMRGQRAAWVVMLGLCLKHLGYDSSEPWASGWLMEREGAIAQLRILCAEHGDNDWDESLHLADIIDKHLANHLG